MADLHAGRQVAAVFMALALGLAAYMFYDFGWRQPWRLELTRTTLRWRAPLRRIEVPLLSVRQVRRSRIWGTAKELVIDGPRSLSLCEVDGMRPFLATLTTAAPGIELRAGTLSGRRGR